LFGHSDRLSRRELNTRLWLIEDAVARGDVPGALRHYDIALRTSRTAADLLYPVLAQAIADPTIVRALITKLAARPPWRDAFLDYVGGRGPSPVRSAQFFSQLAKAGIAIPEVPRISVVNALARDGSYQEAWAYYRTLRSGVIRQRSRDPDFTAQLQTPSVFDWMPVMNDAGVTASVNDGVFDFAAPSTVGGVILQQIQLLPAGRYRLAGTSVGIDQPREARPYWQLTCTDGKEIGRVELTNSADNAGRFAGTIDVGGNCPVQLLRLVVRPSAVIGGVSGQIDRALLAPDGKGR
ncbi:hypothetical protein, partial [Sphingomonas sp. 179-A 2A2 NHS]|uniref:hypothetical protein n=1 Tax=Sphingomonas sp. 179-A 2A2 NHS TaxID=3374290 RepID=UPI00387A3559